MSWLYSRLQKNSICSCVFSQSVAPDGDAVIGTAKTILAASPAQNMNPSFTLVQSYTFNAPFLEQKSVLTGFPHQSRTRRRRRVQHYHETHHNQRHLESRNSKTTKQPTKNQ